METIYFRSAMLRKKEFQLKTRIVREGGRAYVIKEAIYPEGIRHIASTYANTEQVKALYEENMVCEAEYRDEKLIVPFYNGRTLKQELEQCLKEGNEQGFCSLMYLWKQLVSGKDENSCQFYRTDGFAKIFGEVPELLGKKATAVSNVDCTCDNIFMLEGGQIKILDYEWVYAFPIPVDFVWYRVLRLFHATCCEAVSWKMLAPFLSITEKEMQIYDRMMNNFNDYVGNDREKGIDYAKIGMHFLCPPMETFKQRKRKDYGIDEEKIPKGCNVILYGFGKVGRSYYEDIKEKKCCNVVAVCDKLANYYKKEEVTMIAQEELCQYQFDCIVIAILRESVAQNIRKELLAMGITDSKIVWFPPKRL